MTDQELDQFIIDHMPHVNNIARKIHYRVEQRKINDNRQQFINGFYHGNSDLFSAGIKALVETVHSKTDWVNTGQIWAYAKKRIVGEIINSIRKDSICWWQETVEDEKGIKKYVWRQIEEVDYSNVINFSSPLPTPFQHTERQELKERLQLCSKYLTKKRQRILHLYYEEELPLAEIGKIVGISENTVHKHLTEARKQIKDILEGKKEDVKMWIRPRLEWTVFKKRYLVNPVLRDNLYMEVNRLDKRKQQIINLRYEENKTIKEAATEMNMTPKAFSQFEEFIICQLRHKVMSKEEARKLCTAKHNCGADHSKLIIDVFGKKEIDERLLKKTLLAIDELRSKDRKFIDLCYFKGFGKSGIAKAFEVKEGSVHNIKQIALCNLRKSVLPIDEVKNLCNVRHRCDDPQSTPVLTR